MAICPSIRASCAPGSGSTPPEGEVPVRIPCDVEDVGILEVPLVAVGRAEDRQDKLAAGDDSARNLDVLARVALGRYLHGRGVTQQLLPAVLSWRSSSGSPNRTPSLEGIVATRTRPGRRVQDHPRDRSVVLVLVDGLGPGRAGGPRSQGRARVRGRRGRATRSRGHPWDVYRREVARGHATFSRSQPPSSPTG
jgi:hypothetical protein